MSRPKIEASVKAPPKKEGRAARPKKPAAPVEGRKRRTAEEAREAILDATERRLVEAGPSGIRLQEVAADVGLSHPAILHHFGSRETLVKDVCERRFAAIHEDLVTALGAAAGDSSDIGDIIESVYRALERDGHGRVVMWLALEDALAKRDEPRLREVARAAHALRERMWSGAPPPFEDTQCVIALAALALLADSVMGRAILRDAGIGATKADGQRFRAWMARLLAAHLRPPPPAA